MTGFRIGPLDTDPKYKGQYRVSGKEDELKKILPANYHRETVFVKKVSLCETLSRNRRELDSVVALIQNHLLRSLLTFKSKIPEEYRKNKLHRRSKKRGD